jgi:hypothetical protein
MVGSSICLRGQADFDRIKPICTSRPASCIGILRQPRLKHPGDKGASGSFALDSHKVQAAVSVIRMLQMKVNSPQEGSAARKPHATKK